MDEQPEQKALADVISKLWRSGQPDQPAADQAAEVERLKAEVERLKKLVEEKTEAAEGANSSDGHGA